jgi:4-alpha-glucanotransferase
MSDADLQTLARELGIQPDWIDAEGKRQRVNVAAQRALVEALGFACNSTAQIRASRRRLRRANDAAGLPPLLTTTAGQPTTIGDDGEAIHAGKRFRIELENGDTLEGRFDPDKPCVLPSIEHPGYHRLSIGDAHCLLAVAPARCFSIADLAAADGKRWGVAAQIHALRRAGDGGIGDYGALAELATAAGRMHADALAISPAHAMFSAVPEHCSPYSPSSRRFLNALLTDPRECFDAAEIAAVASGLGPAPEPVATDLIDWAGAGRRKLQLLRALYRRAFDRGADVIPELQAFRERGGEALLQHARFESLHARHFARGRPDWHDWPSNAGGAAETDPGDVDFHCFLQWLAARGLAHAQRSARETGMKIGLIADLAVGSDPEGSDAWAMPDQFLGGARVGAPPDYFNARGQNWGLTTFSPLALRAHGFRAFIGMLRACMRFAGGVRIDHVMGLMRLWLVPRGADALDGAYVTCPLRDLSRLLALESWRSRCIVIGEDLGVVPQGFRERMRAMGILGLDVLLFMRDGENFVPPARWREHAVAMTTTHDTPTLRGWWQGTDIELRRRIDMLAGDGADAERDRRVRDRRALANAIREALPQTGLTEHADSAAFVDAATAFTGASCCELMLLPLEDALGLADQPNLPGTVDQYPNWRRRLPEVLPGAPGTGSAHERLRILATSRQRS